MNSRPKVPQYARNKNVLVVDGSGSRKTRYFIKPSVLQMYSSYVVTDPKGSLIGEVGNALYKNGYRIKVFNTINFIKSMHYNPFAYIHSEKDDTEWTGMSVEYRSFSFYAGSTSVIFKGFMVKY